MLAALASAPTVRTYCDRADDTTLKRRIATLMTTKRRKQPAGKSANSGSPQPAKSKKPAFVSRYIGIDSHITERNGGIDLVVGIAAEKPAGRKLADDINRQCVQLDADGYDVTSVFPVTSGRIVESYVETPENDPKSMYIIQKEVSEDTPSGARTRTETKYYHNAGVGYSVTDGVIITAKLRK